MTVGFVYGHVAYDPYILLYYIVLYDGHVATIHLVLLCMYGGHVATIHIVLTCDHIYCMTDILYVWSDPTLAKCNIL